jgi:hypothetical protein
MTGGNPIAVSSQSISCVRAVKDFTTSMEGKKELLLFCSIPDITRDYMILVYNIYKTMESVSDDFDSNHVQKSKLLLLYAFQYQT